MERTDAELSWHTAMSWADLLELARRFLTDEIPSFPGWGGGALDDESDDLLPALLGANRAGLLSVASQPGCPFGPGHDGWTWGGRAFMGGFASPQAASTLQKRAERAGLWVRAETLEGPTPGAFEIPVGLRDGTPYLVLQSGARSDELEIFEDEIGTSAYGALCHCPLLWIIDPVWGRRERLESLFDPEPTA